MKTAVDSDVIKTYVELGFGLGIIAEMAFDEVRDKNLRALPIRHIFGRNTTRLAIRKQAWLRKIDYGFIELFAPQLSRRIVELALEGKGGIDPTL